MAIAGLSNSLASTNSFVLLVESIPEKYQPLLGSSLQALDGASLLVCSFYFRFVSRQWEYYQYLGLGVAVSTLFCSVFISESPSWYYSRN